MSFETHEAEIKMLARSQRAVVAESTAEKRSIKWTAEGTMNRRIPSQYPVTCASVNRKGMLVPVECARLFAK